MRTIQTPEQSSPTGPGALLQIVREGRATTRAELARYTGLARSTVAQRVDALIAADLLYEAAGGQSTGGRPPTTLAFKHHAGVALVADLGATHARLALSDLAGTPLAEHASERDGLTHAHSMRRDGRERIRIDLLRREQQHLTRRVALRERRVHDDHAIGPFEQRQERRRLGHLVQIEAVVCPGLPEALDHRRTRAIITRRPLPHADDSDEHGHSLSIVNFKKCAEHEMHGS